MTAKETKDESRRASKEGVPVSQSAAPPGDRRAPRAALSRAAANRKTVTLEEQQGSQLRSGPFLEIQHIGGTNASTP